MRRYNLIYLVSIRISIQTPGLIHMIWNKLIHELKNSGNTIYVMMFLTNSYVLCIINTGIGETK